MEVLREAGGAIETGGCEEGLLTDVRDLIWQFAIGDPVEPLPEEAELETYLARRTLALARTCLDESSMWERDALDPWACLRAAVLSPSVLIGLPAVVGSGDADLFSRLASRLAAPADRTVSQPCARAGRSCLRSIRARIVYMETKPLAEVRQDLSKIVEAAVSSHERFDITRNGKRAAVLMSADDYDSLLETLDVLADAELVRDVRRGLREAETGEVATHDEVLADLERRRS
jgi:antitoxin YefM